MSSRVFRRRSATAAWVYAAVAFGIVGMIVAARVLGREEFGIYATALAAVGFFQVLLDLTVEESLTKYGFRYVAAEDWGRLRRLFRQMLEYKLIGGALATGILLVLAPFADELFGEDGVGAALLAAALIPLVQSPENVGATALLLHSRYDLRGAYQAGSGALRLIAIAIGSQYGATEALAAMVVAQCVSTAVHAVVGHVALGRFPHASPRPLGEDAPRHSLVRLPVEHRDGRHLTADDPRPRAARRRRRARRRSVSSASRRLRRPVSPPRARRRGSCS